MSGKRPTLPKSAPAGYVELIQACWADDPKLRPEFEEICMEILPKILKTEAPELIPFLESASSSTAALAARSDGSNISPLMRSASRVFSLAALPESPRSRSDSSRKTDDSSGA